MNGVIWKCKAKKMHFLVFRSVEPIVNPVCRYMESA